ncbi:exodeoxyribonuclease VII small subunit [Desulfoferrobacter suflitae]|uniref:exodeoxyribonuclease VII small subunit n=1 Tax=Desulfoferrobacter suflitae TaxID=2865782 RepID=UPI0021640949|nr:exodeoxyribonuclease VII small subunit [Desulfoferrobacter suflitae]MCK8602719.1 exodeoxyribonuclease VII small subunit [Desulfoferrobacter suflitae]
MAKKKSEQFEDALSHLEKIVEKLERGDLTLEQSLEAFTEGIRLVQLCHKKLEEAENKVQTLLKNQQGEWSAVAFEPGATDATKE